MILVDTSVWIDFFRKGDDVLVSLLEDGEVATHPYIVGELACGHLPRRKQLMGDLSRLPSTVVAQQGEVLAFIEKHELMGEGVGYLDIHLLASVVLSADMLLWTKDKKLASLARRFSLLH